MSTESATDRANLIDLQRGDAAALNRLIDRWQRPLAGFAYRYVQNAADAHDLVAETFVRLYQQRLRLRSETNLSAWLFTTLSNLCFNHHRWKRRHPTIPISAPGSDSEHGSGSGLEAELASEAPSPDAALMRDEALRRLRESIDLLPHDLKVTLLLHHYDRLPYREIAAILHCSPRGVETRLYRARQQLRQALAGFIHEISPT